MNWKTFFYERERKKTKTEKCRAKNVARNTGWVPGRAIYIPGRSANIQGTADIPPLLIFGNLESTRMKINKVKRE